MEQLDLDREETHPVAPARVRLAVDAYRVVTAPSPESADENLRRLLSRIDRGAEALIAVDGPVRSARVGSRAAVGRVASVVAASVALAAGVWLVATGGVPVRQLLRDGAPWSAVAQSEGPAAPTDRALWGDGTLEPAGTAVADSIDRGPSSLAPQNIRSHEGPSAVAQPSDEAPGSSAPLPAIEAALSRLRNEPRSTVPPVEASGRGASASRRTSSGRDGARAAVEPESSSAREASLEATILGRARTALRDRDAEGALREVAVHEARHENGQLVEEREVLRIAALCELGRSEEAMRRRTAFAERYPSSPLLAHTRMPCKGK